jgi:hypothetical protein
VSSGKFYRTRQQQGIFELVRSRLFDAASETVKLTLKPASPIVRQ